MNCGLHGQGRQGQGRARYASPLRERKGIKTIWLFLLFLLLPVCGWAEELAYRGETTLWQDTVWSDEVLVDGILTVAPGVTLEIRPGTVIRFTPFDSNGDGIGEHEIFIQGTLHALGTAAAPIHFTSSADAPAPGAWGAINVMASEEGNRLEHVQVSFAYRGFHAHFASATLTDCEFRSCVRGVQFQEAQVTMQRCRLLDNFNGIQFRDAQVALDGLEVRGSYWGVRGAQSRVTLVNSVIEANLVNGVNLRDCDVTISDTRIAANRKGLYLQQSRGTVRNCAFTGNSEHGIFLEESNVSLTASRMAENGRAGVKWVASSGELRTNRFEANGEYALVNDGVNPVTAQGNWWGTTDPSRIAALIRDRVDLPEVGVVDASQPLAAAPVPPLP